MFRATGRLALISVLVCIPTACQQISGTTGAHLVKMDEARASAGKHFTYMVDNAILRDMSLADIHFIAHTTELSGVGTIRLKRMANLLNTYGGTIRLETTQTDETILAERMSHIREFLALSGCDLERVDIEVLAPGGRGMSGVEGVAKYNRSLISPEIDTAASDSSFVPGN